MNADERYNNHSEQASRPRCEAVSGGKIDDQNKNGEAQVKTSVPSTDYDIKIGATTVQKDKVREFGTVVTNHSVTIDGLIRMLATQISQKEFENSLDQDISEALDIPSGSVVNVTYATKENQVNFGIRHTTHLSKQHISNILKNYEYKRIKNCAENERHNEKSKGKLTNKALSDHKDTKDENGKENENNLATRKRRKESIKVLKKTNRACGQNAVQVTEMYGEESNDIDNIQTKHRVGFRGSEWGSVLETKRAALDDAFDTDVSEALGLPRGCVRDATYTLRGLLVAFAVSHPPAMRGRAIDERLKRSRFLNTWGLYPRPKPTEETSDTGEDTVTEARTCWDDGPQQEETQSEADCATDGTAREAVEDGNVLTRHRVGFRGSEWGSVLETKRAALDDAFDTDVSEALGLPRGCV
ncbi:mitotubule-associated protein Gb4, putative, partial [Trypanosoma vivax Y486]